VINSQSPRAWKVTFYQNEMVQAGSERALYEIARSLDRSTFYTRLLARSERPEDHYTRAMRAAGYETRALDLWPPQRGWEHSWWGRRVAPRIHRAYRQKRREEFRALMRDSDLLAVFLAENFRAVRDWLEPGDSVALFHMSHSAQFGRSSLETVEPVDGCTLVLMDEGQREEVERSAWSGQPVELLPLVADLEGLPDSFVVPRPPWKIGVFTRLAADKPLAPFFFALQCLRQRVPATLHVYGYGDASEYQRLLRQLDLSSVVAFEGHRRDLASVFADGLAVGWMHAVGDFVGYASLELAARGLPLQFWNLGGGSSRDSIVAPANDARQLAEQTARLLSNEESLRQRGRDVRAWAASRHDRRRLLPRVQSVFERLVQRRASRS
jgi:glycosyltransferase involved in cell wall biosynthesis